MKSSKAGGVSPATLSASYQESGPVLELDRWLLRALMKGVGSPPVGAALWDGKDATEVTGAPLRLVIRSRGTLLRLITNPLLYFGDDYSAGNIEIEGDLVSFLELIYRAMARPGEVRRRSGRLGRWQFLGAN